MSATIENSTPRADGFRMPGEFEPHAQTWIHWPQLSALHRLGCVPVRREVVQVATAIAEFEPVTVIVNHEQFVNARSMLPAHIRVVELSFAETGWLRDIGLIFVKNDRGEVRVTHWEFTGYGQLDPKYFSWDKENLIPQKIAEIERLDRYRVPMVFEGGAFHVDGEGTLLTEEGNLLRGRRNPELTSEQMEKYIKDYLGVEKIIWLPASTDPDSYPSPQMVSHIDCDAHFVRPGVLVVAWTDDESDWRYEAVHRNYEHLQSVTDARGRSFEIHKMPMPVLTKPTREEVQSFDASALPGLFNEWTDWLPLNYLNHYICNGGVIMPVFGDAHDDEAYAVLSRLHPERKVVRVPSRETWFYGGGPHCLTQQQPRG
jgi:agmatine deiminase